MDPERLEVVLEGDEHLQEDIIPAPPDTDENEIPAQPPEPDLGAEEEGQGAPKPQGPEKGQVKKLTEYFNKMGGQNTPKAPKKTQNEPKTPKTPKNRKIIGGINKTSNRKKRNKIEEPERARMELALRTFLKKKPPDQTSIEEGGAGGNM